PKMRESLSITLDSPPGITSPRTSSSSAGLRMGRASAPSPASTAMCSRTSPWRARTPTGPGSSEVLVVGLPATLGEAVRRSEVGDVDADHCFAQPARRLRDDGGVIVEGGRLDDGCRT